MASLQELRTIREQKLELLVSNGEKVYETVSTRTHSISEIIDQFEKLVSEEAFVTIAGRVLAIRGQGSILFITLWDGTDQFQAVFQVDKMDSKRFDLFVDGIDIGDFIDVSGYAFTTQRGQDSVQVTQWRCLSKSLLPLPDKWAGLVDDEERYRNRYLELISEPDVFQRFKIRSQTVKYIRAFFDNLGFMEVETPILQSQAGGAMAKTFDTFHEDLQIPLVMRISLELEHKILVAGGFPAIYEIGKNFRNEGSDPSHIQEFTMIEWYWAYHTLNENMTITEKLLRGILFDVMHGKNEYIVYDKEGNSDVVNFGDLSNSASVWPRLRFDDLVLEKSGISVRNSSTEEIQSKARELGMLQEDLDQTGRGNLLDFIFKKTVRPTIVNPAFITNYPAELKPLAQQNDDGTAEVAQLIIAGTEITNQYAELINPIVQRTLLEQQSQAKAGGDAEAMEIDERFLGAMEHGMPPMTGFGMGIDRLVAILTEQRNLREVIFSPIMRPENQ